MTSIVPTFVPFLERILRPESTILLPFSGSGLLKSCFSISLRGALPDPHGVSTPPHFGHAEQIYQTSLFFTFKASFRHDSSRPCFSIAN